MTTREINIRLRGDATSAQQALRRVGQQANQTAQDMQRRFQAATQRIKRKFQAWKLNEVRLLKIKSACLGKVK